MSTYREPAPKDDPDLRLILTAWRRSSAKFRSAVPFLLVLAVLCVAVGLGRDDTQLAVIGGVFFPGLAIFLVLVARKTERSSAARALENDPGQIRAVQFAESRDARGIFRTQWLHVRTLDGHVALRVDGDLDALTDALARRCPKASFRVPGRDERGAKSTT